MTRTDNRTKPPSAAATWLTNREVLSVVPLVDPVVDSLGYDMRSDYVETFWLPTLGPSAVLAARRLVAWLDDAPEGFDIPMVDFAASIGLGTGLNANSPVVRTLARLAQFRFAAVGGSAYAIRRYAGPLPGDRIARLPEYLRAHAAVAR